MKLDLHTHYYTPAYFERIERSGGDFSFGASPTGQRIIRYKGARFFGVTAPMTDVGQRLEDMDRVGIDVEVLSLSAPNVFFAEGRAQTDVARMVNDAYADLITKRPGRFLGFASIPMDDPDGALRELARALEELPNIRWLIAHAGGAIPYLLERLDSGWRDFAECRANIDEPPSTYLRRLYYDTVTFSPNNLRLLRDVVGTDHMAMGSDYPHLLGSIDKAISSIEGLDWDAREKERVFSGTALALLANLPARLAHVV